MHCIASHRHLCIATDNILRKNEKLCVYVCGLSYLRSILHITNTKTKRSAKKNTRRLQMGSGCVCVNVYTSTSHVHNMCTWVQFTCTRRNFEGDSYNCRTPEHRARVPSLNFVANRVIMIRRWVGGKSLHERWESVARVTSARVATRCRAYGVFWWKAAAAGWSKAKMLQPK